MQCGTKRTGFGGVYRCREHAPRRRSVYPGSLPTRNTVQEEARSVDIMMRFTIRDVPDDGSTPMSGSRVVSGEAEGTHEVEGDPWRNDEFMQGQRAEPCAVRDRPGVRATHGGGVRSCSLSTRQKGRLVFYSRRAQDHGTDNRDTTLGSSGR